METAGSFRETFRASDVRAFLATWLVATILMSVWLTGEAYGQTEERETVVFLTGETCEKDLQQLTERLSNYHVVCAYRSGPTFEVEPNVAWTRMHYQAFEKYFYVIYVQNEYYKLTDEVSVAGITFGSYSISIPADFVIEHERLHQVCQCLHTPDGYHD